SPGSMPIFVRVRGHGYVSDQLLIPRRATAPARRSGFGSAVKVRIAMPGPEPIRLFCARPVGEKHSSLQSAFQFPAFGWRQVRMDLVDADPRDEFLRPDRLDRALHDAP